MNRPELQQGQDTAPRDVGGLDDVKKRKITCGGGPWRAFVHDCSPAALTTLVNNQRAAELYRSAKQEGGQRWAELQARGEVVCQAHRDGGATLGHGRLARISAVVAPLLRAMQQGTRQHS